MDIKITKKRLNDHLSYDWWKYIAILLVCIFFWSLVFTVSAPRLAMSKKLEIFFITNNFRTDKSEDLRNGLKETLNSEFIEIQLNNYVPDDSTTSQVLTARLSINEGDLYAFPFADSTVDEEQGYSNNMFGNYVDYGIFADFETLINDAKQFYNDRITDIDQFRVQYGDLKEYNTEEKLINGFDVYMQTRLRANNEAIKLEGYINDYKDNGDNLFYSYERFTIYSQLNPEENLDIEEEKIWGINFNALDRITDTNHGGFFYPYTTGNNESIPLDIAMGIVSFKEDNMPLYYENLAVINYFIDNYYIE